MLKLFFIFLILEYQKFCIINIYTFNKIIINIHLIKKKLIYINNKHDIINNNKIIIYK